MASTSNHSLIFRVQSKKRVSDLSGQGAALRGSRWTLPGQFVLYAAESFSLACREIAIRMPTSQLHTLGFMYREIIVPKTISITSIKRKSLSEGWDNPNRPSFLKDIGGSWYTSSETCLLQVPSTITPSEKNYIVNVTHKDFKKLTFSKPKTLLKYNEEE